MNDPSAPLNWQDFREDPKVRATRWGKRYDKQHGHQVYRCPSYDRQFVRELYGRAQQEGVSGVHALSPLFAIAGKGHASRK